MNTKLFYALFLACVFNTISGQQTTGQQSPPDQCMMKCMNELYQGSKNWDAKAIIPMENVQIGNVTTQCPKLNDTQKFDQACQVVANTKRCADQCPDTPVKKVSMGSLKFLIFICVDRVDDVKKYLPCLSDECPDVERQCVPKCGSITATSNQIMETMKQQHTGGQSPTIDPQQISKLIGKTCSTVSCCLTCSEPITTKKCGKGAYLLERDLLWSMFTSVSQALTAMGAEIPTPDECKQLAAVVSSNDTEAGARAGTETPIPTPIAGATNDVIHGNVTVETNKTAVLKEGGTTAAPGGSSSIAATFLAVVLLPVLAYSM